MGIIGEPVLGPIGNETHEAELFATPNRISDGVDVVKVRHLVSRSLHRVSFFTPVQAIFIIVTLSAIVKLGYIFVMGGGPNAFPTEGTDVSFYEAGARNLLTTGIYGDVPGQPTTGMPPGQSYFLALLYAVSSGSIAFAKLAHVALLTLVAVLTFLTVKELAGATVGFWAGALTAVDPSLAYLSGTFLSDALFIFVMVLGIYLLVKERSCENFLVLIVVGICFGVAGLTRNQGWLFTIALWSGSLVTLGRLIPIRAATIILLATVATVAPWTWRNYQLSGEFIPVSSEGGLTLWASNNPEFVLRPPMPMSGGIYDAPPGLSGPQIDQYYRDRASEWITSHPRDFVVNGLKKVLVLYSFDPLSWRPEVAGFYRLAGLFPYGILVPFVLLGLVFNVRNSKFGIVLWYVLFTTLMAAVFYGDSRIRAPIQPYLYVFGMLGLQMVYSRWRRWNQQCAVMPGPIREQS